MVGIRGSRQIERSDSSLAILEHISFATSGLNVESGLPAGDCVCLTAMVDGFCST